MEGIFLRILWACGYDNFDSVKRELLALFESEGRQVTLTEKFHKNGVVKELAVGNYDLVITYEFIEQVAYDIKTLESILENYPKTRFIYVINEEHSTNTKLTQYLNINLYNIIYVKDLDAAAINDLYKAGKNRTEAKLYLNIESRKLFEDDVVIDQELANGISHTIMKAPAEKRVFVFEDICKKLSAEQVYQLVNYLSCEVIDELAGSELIASCHTDIDVGEDKGNLSNILAKIKNYSRENVKERIVEKVVPRIVEKEVYIEKQVKTLDTAVITMLSASSNGKSYLSWNLANYMADNNYSTTVLNNDFGYSANLYYAVPDKYQFVLQDAAGKGSYIDVLNNCYKPKENLNILTGPIYSDFKIGTQAFIKLLNIAKGKTDIVILDCATGLNELTELSVIQSNINILIYDLDSRHFHFNRKLIEELGDSLIAEKTIVVINYADTKSDSFLDMYEHINAMKLPFRDIIPISYCGALGCDLIGTYTTPYHKNEGFKNDMDVLLEALKVKTSTKKKSLFKKIFK